MLSQLTALRQQLKNEEKRVQQQMSHTTAAVGIFIMDNSFQQIFGTFALRNFLFWLCYENRKRQDATERTLRRRGCGTD